MPSTVSRASTQPLLRRTLLTALSLILTLLGALAGHAYASEGSQYGAYGQYGEVTRFGGFDTTWFDEGLYDGRGGTPNESEPKPGEFIDPVGFAVDTNDEGSGATAVYVLDRVSGNASEAGSQGTEWRLQKLSATGEPLASAEFYLPKSTVISGADYKVFVGVVGLAVDDSTGRIYTVLYDSVSGEEEEEENTTREVEEVLDWSTTPSGGKLVAPQDATLDKVSTPVSGYSSPGVVSTVAQLQSGSVPLYEPQGLAIDDAGGQDAVAIAADANVRGDSGEIGGPAVVEQVSTTSGAEQTSWLASSLKSVTNATTEDTTALSAGISTDPGGDLNVLLDSGSAALDDVGLSANLTAPTVLASGDIDPLARTGGHTYPAAALPDDAAPTTVANVSGNLGRGGDKAASAQVVALSNGLYASGFLSEPPATSYWSSGPANEGIRLLSPETGGLLSNPLAPVTSVFDTLANATTSGPCNIGFGATATHGLNYSVTLAAGANGSIWVLTGGWSTTSYTHGSGSDAAYITGRQVIEFAPGAANTCVGPTGTFNVAKEGGSPQPASTSSPLIVPVGSTVDFNAAPIEYPQGNGGKPAGIYAYEWDPTLGATLDPGYTQIDDTVPSTTLLPEQTTGSYQYTTPGVYTIGLKLLGDFGEYDETGTVIVQTAGLPTASFNAPSEAQTGQSVTLDASASKPASGASIAAYEWKFGDGATDDTQTPSDTHTYTTPGTYTITLTVRDNDNQQSTSVTKQITITNPPSNENNNSNSNNNTSSNNSSTGGSSGSSGTTTSATSATVTPPASTSNNKPKTLTTAQKLAAALKACKKDKSKKQRTSCEKAAKKKYTTKTPTKKKSIKKDKKK